MYDINSIDVICRPRQHGKTTDLIEMSAVTNTPILCYNHDMALRIRRKAQEMETEIPNPICLNTNLHGTDIKGVLVDDAELILQYLLNERAGMGHPKVKAIAVSGRIIP
jgi:hypothetical protein